MSDNYELSGKSSSTIVYNDYTKITDYDESYRKMPQLTSDRKVIVPGELKYWNAHIVPNVKCEFKKNRDKPIPTMSKSAEFTDKDNLNKNCYANY